MPRTSLLDTFIKLLIATFPVKPIFCENGITGSTVYGIAIETMLVLIRSGSFVFFVFFFSLIFLLPGFLTLYKGNKLQLCTRLYIDPCQSSILANNIKTIIKVWLTPFKVTWMIDTKQTNVKGEVRFCFNSCAKTAGYGSVFTCCPNTAIKTIQSASCKRRQSLWCPLWGSQPCAGSA